VLAVAGADVAVLALALGVLVWHGTPWTPPLPGAREPVVAALADLPKEQAKSARWSVLVLSEEFGSQHLLTRSTGQVDFTSDRWHGTFQIGDGGATEELRPRRHRPRQGQLSASVTSWPEATDVKELVGDTTGLLPKRDHTKLATWSTLRLDGGSWRRTPS
jgi:hypothetical protein